MQYIYTMELQVHKGTSAIKNKNIKTFAGRWMELENIILSEVTET
jgi:hypothetical protein